MPCPFWRIDCPIRGRRSTPHCRTFQIAVEFRQCQDVCRGLPRVLGSCQRRFVKQIGSRQKICHLDVPSIVHGVIRWTRTIYVGYFNIRWVLQAGILIGVIESWSHGVMMSLEWYSHWCNWSHGVMMSLQWYSHWCNWSHGDMMSLQWYSHWCK
ncbi:hypothetical protein CEXT_509411 [Caerostris extrusa]|uniref:Uncharacterized protein n=1 Tax=Caerostris extrusa TaxID=172846 RepID=A0AAV4NAP0_CAEEX|nr:hypothetical protein CEXT_509411 [Caerostris extrusa]